MSDRARTIAAAAAFVALTLLSGACAVPAGNVSGPDGSTVDAPVIVSNESPEIVHIHFIGENGMRLRIGSVPPYSSATFSPRFVRSTAGHFHTHRLGTGAQAALIGRVDPWFFRGEPLEIRIGSSPEFDRWQRRPTGSRLSSR